MKFPVIIQNQLVSCIIFIGILLVITFTPSVEGAASNSSSKDEEIPRDKDALSLWLIARTGWVYCARAAEYIEDVEEEFDEKKCQDCYINMFDDMKDEPENVSDNDILDCARNFGSSDILLRDPRGGGAIAQTCDAELMVAPFDFLGVRETFVESHRRFSIEKAPKKRFPRKSYVQCLLGKLYEVEYALCKSTRRKCATEKKKEDEERIFSSEIPISYKDDVDDEESD